MELPIDGRSNIYFMLKWHDLVSPPQFDIVEVLYPFRFHGPRSAGRRFNSHWMAQVVEKIPC